MATVATRPMSAADFYEFVHRPENRDRVFELERGEIVEMSRPGKKHGLVCGNGVRLLGNYAAARKRGYVCSNDTGVVVAHNPDTVRGPDILFFDDATSIDQVEEKYGETPPRLAVEVLSPNDTTIKVMQRVFEQLSFGADMVWVVDPESEQVAVYRRGKEPYLLHRDDELTGDDVLPEFRCKVADFFKLPGQ
jgi:Uma2 family endonuclease